MKATYGSSMGNWGGVLERTFVIFSIRPGGFGGEKVERLLGINERWVGLESLVYIPRGGEMGRIFGFFY